MICSEMATGMYGSSMVYGIMGEMDSPSDMKYLLGGVKDKEGYRQAFCDHCHLPLDALLYTSWGDSAPSLYTHSGMPVGPPPFFLVRQEASQSLVLCVRGTWSTRDFVTDFKCEGVAWEEGQAHEGIALVAEAIAGDAQLRRVMDEALEKNPGYKVVVVGHSLGAGIAALLTIRWRLSGLFGDPVCFAFAPPPCLSKEVLEKGVGFIYSFVNEDDIVPRLSKDGIMDALHLIMQNCHEKRRWIKKGELTTQQIFQTMVNESTLVNMVLPGTVIYLHPCMEKYAEYERRKRMISDVRLFWAYNV